MQHQPIYLVLHSDICLLQERVENGWAVYETQVVRKLYQPPEAPSSWRYAQSRREELANDKRSEEAVEKRRPRKAQTGN
jgi:hypothetical protein